MMTCVRFARKARPFHRELREPKPSRRKLSESLFSSLVGSHPEQGQASSCMHGSGSRMYPSASRGCPHGRRMRGVRTLTKTGRICSSTCATLRCALRGCQAAWDDQPQDLPVPGGPASCKRSREARRLTPPPHSPISSASLPMGASSAVCPLPRA